MIGPEIRSALRDAVRDVRARIALDPSRYNFPDDEYRRDAIAAIAANVVRDRVDADHISISKLAHLALVEIDTSAN